MLTILTRIVETSVVRTSGAGEAWGADATELPAVVAPDDAILLLDTGGAIFARAVLTRLSAQLAESSVIADGTFALVGTRR